jgi:uncharacterized protein YndB with AHSA1/START domain
MAAGKDPPVESMAGREIVTTRVIAATPARLFEAFRDPDCLEQWWGPKDFTCTIHQFDLRPGGKWRLTLHGPDGTDYRNEKEFVAVETARRVVFRHLDPLHAFEMTIAFTPQGAGTLVYWRLRFDSPAECARVRIIVVEANEQNLDRLEADLTTVP